MPRSGSKFVDRNLNEYIKHKRNNSGSSLGCQSIFCQQNEKDKIIVNSKWQTNILNDISLLYNIINKHTFYTTAKIHPVSIWEKDLIKKLNGNAFKSIATVRCNKFEQCISWAVMHKLNSWALTSDSNSKIEELCCNPFHIDEADFLSYSTLYEEQINFIDTLDNIRVVDLDQLLTIKNSREFCTLLGLDTLDFQIKFDYHIEYGTKKFDMVKNISDLKKLL